MKKYISRLSAPSRTDKRFINYNYGGYNTCIVINKETGYVMPNCVGYAHGRLLEILEENSVNWKLPACNAEDWYEKAQNAGFSVGFEPKLGAVACWKSGQLHNGSDGAGHVAVVEEIKANGDIIVSASGYGGTEFYTQSIPKASGYVYMDGLAFVGFIYCGIEFETFNDDLNSNTIPNRFKVVTKDGKQINAYTNYSYARKFADANNAVIIDSVNATQVYPTNKEDEKPDTIIPPSSESEDFNNNTIENRFKIVNKDGKQIGAYTKYSYACKTAEENNAVVIDSVNGKQVYPSESIKEELTAISYSDYTDGSTYRVMRRFNEWNTSKGAFCIWKNAFKKWSTCKNDGYHIYDKNGNQLD